MIKLYRVNRWLCMSAICVMILLSMSIGAMAQEQIDLNRPVSVTVQLTAENVPVQGVDFHIYQVAELTADGRAVLTGPFSGYSISLEGSDYDALCQTLTGYVLRDQIAPVRSAVTDESGEAVLEGGLRPGLYLIVGGSFVLNNSTYLTESSLLWLPDRENDVLSYDVVIQPKWERLQENDSLTVIKVWEDAGHEGVRPAAIRAQLVEAGSGQVREETILNSENNWRHTWDNLPSGYHWYVVERQVPENYTVTSVRDGSTVVLKNVYQEEPGSPGNSDTPEGPGRSGDSGTPEESKAAEGKTVLPQTGTLKWLVPVLALCGMGLFLTGWLLRRHDEQA